MRGHADDKDMKLFLVGTKVDLPYALEREEVIQYAYKLGAEYWEVSAKQDIGVTELLNRIAFTTFWYLLEKWDAQMSTLQEPSASNQQALAPKVPVTLKGSKQQQSNCSC